MNSQTPNQMPPSENTPPSEETNVIPERRSTSKISKLPAATRDRLNQMLADGLTYPQTLEQLGEEAKDLNEMDLSRWMHSGHKLWIQRQLWLHHVSSSFDAAKDIVNNSKAASIHEANLHLAATQMHDAIIGCDLITLPNAVKEDTEKLFRILHAIPQYAHQALNFQKYKEACAQARTELQKLRDPSRTLTDEERRAIVDKVDEVLGLK